MATLEQVRHVELVSGARQRFVVTSSMTAATIPDQLPHLGVFVMRIITRDDSQDDTFQRVARIADLSELPEGRVAGLASATGVDIDYLATIVVLGYSTLTEAKSAATAIKDRVSALITEWTDFKVNFDAPDVSPEIITIPSVDDSQVDALIAAYKTAKQDRYEKSLLKLEADAALTRANTDYNYKRAREVELDAMVAKGIIVENDMDAATGFLSALWSAGTTFIGLVAGLPADVAEFGDALNTAENQASIMASYEVDVATLTGLINGYDAARVVEVAAASTTLSAAQADQITKAQALITAQVTETAALAEVLAVCPDFDKNSIPMVDDNEP
jgi:hypothetical protein